MSLSIYGIYFALASSLFIGLSYVIKKISLRKLDDSHRANRGGHSYLKDPLWWLGFLTMAFGEICNFVAFGALPASMVTMLGSLSIVVSAILSWKILKEKLDNLSIIGCILTIIGCSIIVIQRINDGGSIPNYLEEAKKNYKKISVISYGIGTLIFWFIVSFRMGDRTAHKNILVYLLVCGSFGSFGVVCAKIISGAFQTNNIFKEKTQLIDLFFIILLTIFLLMTQVHYLNKSLDTFPTALVTTVNFVLFNLFTIFLSSQLFTDELHELNTKQFLTIILSFFIVLIGLSHLVGQHQSSCEKLPQ
ncbi:hypothetical protein SNEBB_000403 [Seison nebaliae]|nr:hypothetical protein SNEBB_000403 [Seison nebaliae]